MEIVLIVLLLAVMIAISRKKDRPKRHNGYNRYRRTAYHDASGNSVFDTLFDTGNFGEFLTYSCLENLGEAHKLLANVYLPKSDGTTTEIDLIMISATGIYVFESKNYSGWIFGDENSRYWKQTFRGGRHFQFYNPIWQNKKHISVLKQHLGLGDEVFRSYVVFSEHCVLKKLLVHSPEVKVMSRDDLMDEMMEDMERLPEIFSPLEIEQLFVELSRYTRADGKTKQAHIDAMEWKKL
ncbi:nuclease-like protein [Trichococcus patagoniensis]|uniref:Nuclease-like protein n=1 Tax=Trichococcus patagoniensis TaxID=382641 RepID=A0A2T5IQ84_9LACT|nr:nuclease-related domain-containing protein [Trichococcus patagoniensis]PTQ85987.1 nuclease-like protein [Trichococcus patagoniensis]